MLLTLLACLSHVETALLNFFKKSTMISPGALIDEFRFPGLIERVEITNFAKHGSLVLRELATRSVIQIIGGPEVGKTSIIGAILFAFGSQFDAHNELIRLNKSCAEVAVTLRNNTSFGSFEPQKFGDFIHIQRRITRRNAGVIIGPGGIEDYDEYSISSSSRLVVYKTETALKRILDFFKIDIDNPLMVMTKESLMANLVPASGSNEETLYLLFEAAISGLSASVWGQLISPENVAFGLAEKFRRLNPSCRLNFDHASRRLSIVESDVDENKTNHLVIAMSLLLLFWEQSNLSVKFFDDIDKLFDKLSSADRERALTVLERIHQSDALTGQLFIISETPVFSPETCRDHHVLILELRCRKPSTTGNDRPGAAIEA